MTPFQSTSLIIFGIFVYIIVMDSNVSEYLTLVFKMTQVNIERLIWMIRFHPRNPITNWIKYYEYEKIAKELEEEFNQK